VQAQSCLRACLCLYKKAETGRIKSAGCSEVRTGEETVVAAPWWRGAPRTVSGPDVGQAEPEQHAEYGPRKTRPSLEKTQEAPGRLSSGDSGNTGLPYLPPWRAGSVPGSSLLPFGQSRRLSESRLGSSPRKMKGEPEWRSQLSRGDVSCGASSCSMNPSKQPDRSRQSLLSLLALSGAQYSSARASLDASRIVRFLPRDLRVRRLRPLKDGSAGMRPHGPGGTLPERPHT